jgi:uncharacterized protein
MSGGGASVRQRLLTRRVVLGGLGATVASGALLGSYGVATAELGHKITRYALTPPRWPKGFKLRLAVITDLHACEPWMGAERIAQIVAETNMLGADIVLLLGDYAAGRALNRITTRSMPDTVWASALANLKAPLGVHAVLGNHDWWSDLAAMRARKGPTATHRALAEAGIPLYENKAVRFEHKGQPFWLAGLGDQWAFYGRRSTAPDGTVVRYTGVDDLDGTLAQVTGSAPVILMAHEPDIFPRVPARVSLTLSGHTHGGQIQVAGFAPVVPSRYGRRYRYGHIVEGGRDLIVSAGLGCGAIPVRIGTSPEIVLVELG